MNTCLRWLLRVLFRFRAFNEAVLRTPGPVLLVPNHLSLLDWLFVGVCLESDWRFVVSKVAAQASWLRRRIALNRRTFPIEPTSAYAFKHVAEYLRRGGRLVMFAEGRLSRTGSLAKLFEGSGFLLHRVDARVITAYLRGAQRLPSCAHPNRKSWLPRVTIHFSELLTPPRTEGQRMAQARRRLTRWLRDALVRQQFEVETALGPRTVSGAVLAAARARRNMRVLEDVTFRPLTYRRLIMGADLLAGVWKRQLDSDGTRRVGVLLPNVNAAPVVLLSLWAADRVPAILNYSAGMATVTACARLAGLQTVISSRAFVVRARLDVKPLEAAGIRMVWIEEVRGTLGRFRRLGAAVRHRCRVGWGLREPEQPVALVLFTSGSEGVPKGVQLTHANLLANLRQIMAVIDILDDDRMFNAMPLFHSFGVVVGTLLPLMRGIYSFLYPSPLHYRVVPTMVYERDCTILIATNTFLNGYARRADPYDFRRLRYLVAGAEKVQSATAATWAQQFGARILEGYGATECSPVISVNTPHAARPGTTGRLLPGMEWRTEPVEGMSDGGRLFVRGPNVMLGYLNPEANAAFEAAEGWYDTGDIARVDEEGFVTILGRLKRFAKISGEMVSLTAVEEALGGAFPQFGPRCEVAVLSRPDVARGETLVAITNEPRLRLDEVAAAIRAAGLGNLCIPRGIQVVPEIPKLGSGKTDYQALARISL